MTSSIYPIRFPFGGHEKFVFRQGWLKKGLDAAQADPAIFTRPDAFVTLTDLGRTILGITLL